MRPTLREVICEKKQQKVRFHECTPGGPNSSNWRPCPTTVAGGERGHLRLGDHRHGLEVEVVEGLSGWQPSDTRWRSM
jgi:hypothetical protein